MEKTAKISQLKFWNKQNNNTSKDKDKDADAVTETKNGANKEDSKAGKRNWLHTPEALINGHVVYLVKFFGNVPVDQPKGIEVVKDTIRKLQFAQQMKKAETGTQEKFKKVEITISVDGVAVQEPRTQKILHQFPLHNISYCADEKGVKKFFSFIAKTVKPAAGDTSSSNGRGSSPDGSTQSSSTTEDTHECFVFISNKLASDITLTIGQAFELAFRKYVSTTEKTELGKAQQQIADLEKTVNIYKNRLRDLSQKLSKSDLDGYLFKQNIKDILEVPAQQQTVTTNGDASQNLTNGSNGLSNHDDKTLLIDTNSTNSLKSSLFLPAVPPRNNNNNTTTNKSMNNNAQKMEELLLNSDSDSDFDPRAEESTDGNSTGSGKNISNDLFGFEPSNSFGQQLFYNNNDNKFHNNNNNNTSIISNNTFSELTVTPPLLAPPPKVSASRRSTSVTNSTSPNAINNLMTNGNNNNNNLADLFGSDPFDTSNTVNHHHQSIFPQKLSKISVDDFTLESLDPLRK
ncbi:PTB domain-containing adapter protein ced-6 [Musca vetustissima]|uniref:PTB domain-containing adapter protein ced-6 n=1 Tax=Musca vetustissima TaxID=27455 RepID=UPI002AB7BDEE|nr:PTB domain-containing adapter protein ced-6 [Musca vetustissima]